MKNTFVITIDGPAGVGKSTIAQKTAQHFAIPYLDTGAMFRLLALKLASFIDVNKHTLLLSDAALAQQLSHFTFTLLSTKNGTTLLCNNVPADDAIRTEEVGLLASIIATNVHIRGFLKKSQQHLGATTSLLAEGRDMGTIVFPTAICKIFLDASPQIRALRRYNQLQNSNVSCNFEELTLQIAERDTIDRNRSIAPLRPADNAYTIDTSTLSLDDVFTQIVHYCTQKLPSSS